MVGDNITWFLKLNNVNKESIEKVMPVRFSLTNPNAKVPVLDLIGRINKHASKKIISISKNKTSRYMERNLLIFNGKQAIAIDIAYTKI